MTEKNKKWYTVWKGRRRGVFHSRDTCKESVHGFAGAQYKSYPSLKEAQDALDKPYKQAISPTISRQEKQEGRKALATQGIIETNSIAVDASCLSNPGKLERRGVETISGNILFTSDTYPLGTTNIGEWLAIIQGMQYILKMEKKNYTIYSDSRIAIRRIKHKTIKTQLIKNNETTTLRKMIDTSLIWLRSHYDTVFHDMNIHLSKRKTKERGEIPADFGRK